MRTRGIGPNNIVAITDPRAKPALKRSQDLSDTATLVKSGKLPSRRKPSDDARTVGRDDRSGKFISIDKKDQTPEEKTKLGWWAENGGRIRKYTHRQQGNPRNWLRVIANATNEEWDELLAHKDDRDMPSGMRTALEAWHNTQSLAAKTKDRHATWEQAWGKHAQTLDILQPEDEDKEGGDKKVYAVVFPTLDV